MAVWTPQKKELFDTLAEEFLHNYSHGRTLLAVDGLAGTDTAAFADALVERLGRRGHAAFRASMAGFHRPRAERPTANDSGERQYADSYDYALFRRVLVEPFTMGGSAGFVTAAWDVARDTPVEMAWQTGPRDATLVVDGGFLNRPELRGLWSYSIWLEPEGVGGGGDEAYVAEAKPRDRAAAIVDNSDSEHPRRVFADSC